MKKNNKYTISLLTIMPALSIGTTAFAQTINAPASVNPERIEQSIEPIIPTKPKPPGYEVEKEEDKTKKSLKYQNRKNEIKFKLRDVIIEGTTKIPLSDLKKVYADKINKDVTLPELKNLAQEVENYYRSKGYFIARVIIPPQRIKKEAAAVKFVVLEGRISKVNIMGNPGKSTAILESYLSSIAEDSAITEQALEKALLLSNDIPGIKAQAIIAPSATVVGAAELNVKVTRSNPGGFLSFDNRGTKYVGNQQLRAGGNVYGVLGPDLFYTDFMTAVPDNSQLQSFGGLYKLYFGGAGTSVALNARHTITRPGLELRPLGLQGRSTRLDLTFNQPIIRTRANNLSFNIGTYIANSKNIFTSTNSVFYNDKVRAIYLGTNYTHTAPKSNFMFDLRFTKGLNIAAATTSEDEFKSRENGTSNFLKTNLNVSYTRNFTDSLSAFLSGTAQHSTNSLLSGEQFGYGGEAFGSAFDSSEIIGDKGIAGKIEFRYTKFPKIRDVNYIQLFAAYDRGKIWNLGATDQPKYADGASYSFGVRFGLMQKISTSIELAKPLMRDAATDNTKKFRLFAKFTATF